MAATPPTTRTFVCWLPGCGGGAVIHEPISLREQLGGIAQRMATTYV